MSTGTDTNITPLCQNHMVCFSYFILPSVIPPEHIAIMTEVIERAIAERNKSLHHQNTTDEDDGLILCSADGKYFFFMHEDSEPEMNKIIFSSYMEQIAKGLNYNSMIELHKKNFLLISSGVR